MEKRHFTIGIALVLLLAASVASLEVEPVTFTGATTDMARLRAEYSDDGDPGPETLIAKIRGVREVQVQMDQAMGLFEREARFYATFADGGVPPAQSVASSAGGTTPGMLV